MLLLEDVSGEYREWLDHQEHRGRPFSEDTDVLETEVRFSVTVPDRMREPFVEPAGATPPLFIHHPEMEELSSPQLDMLFDVMSFLYQNIPAMKLMEDFQIRRVAEIERTGVGQRTKLAEKQEERKVAVVARSRHSLSVSSSLDYVDANQARTSQWSYTPTHRRGPSRWRSR
jgi:hypothetical protein